MIPAFVPYKNPMSLEQIDSDKFVMVNTQRGGIKTYFTGESFIRTGDRLVMVFFEDIKAAKLMDYDDAEKMRQLADDRTVDIFNKLMRPRNFGQIEK